MDILALKVRLEKEKIALAEFRDRLRDIEDEASELRSNCEDALDSFEYAIDALSRLV